MKKSNSTRAVWAMPAISLDRTEAVKKGIAEAKKVCRDRNRFLEFGHVLSLLRQLYVSPEDLAAEFGCSKRRIYMMLSGHDAVKRTAGHQEGGREAGLYPAQLAGGLSEQLARQE